MSPLLRMEPAKWAGEGRALKGRTMFGVRSHKCLLYNISVTYMIRVCILFYVIYFTLEVKSKKIK